MKFLTRIISLPLILSLFFSLTACDPDDTDEKGSVRVEITDAPIDNAEVKAVFVTVADVQIDGESYAGFEGKQTVDLMALQQGNTALLGVSELEAGSYSSLTLVLDYESDDQGVSPGCYVQDTLNEKFSLAASGQTSGSFTLMKDLEVMANAETNLVIDVDLRKAVKQTGSGAAKGYQFVSDASLRNAMRVVAKTEAGVVAGSLSANLVGESGTVVVYAYKKGSFNKDIEAEPNGDGLQFRNAVSSTLAVKSGNDYAFSLHFLEAGEYELCYAVYEDEDGDGEATFEGFLQTSVGLGGNITSDVGVSVGVNAALTVNIFGILRL